MEAKLRTIFYLGSLFVWGVWEELAAVRIGFRGEEGGSGDCRSAVQPSSAFSRCQVRPSLPRLFFLSVPQNEVGYWRRRLGFGRHG